VSNLLIAPSADWSFPSDHATASMAIAAAFFLARLPGRGVVFLVFALAICLSRVFVGTHYVGDVLGGAATGILAAVAVRLIYRENSRLDRFATGLL
jgi:undecaprenyl-diphosphatase